MGTRTELITSMVRAFEAAGDVNASEARMAAAFDIAEPEVREACAAAMEDRGRREFISGAVRLASIVRCDRMK